MPEFFATKCIICEKLYGHPIPVCRKCGSEKFRYRSIDGDGTVYASTIIRVPGVNHQGDEPFEVCLVSLNKNLRVTARIKDSPGLEPGDAVTYIGSRDGSFWFKLAKK